MFGMKTIISLAISSVLFLLSESLIAGERGGGVGFAVPLPQSVNPAPSQPATSRAPVARAPHPNWIASRKVSTNVDERARPAGGALQ